MSCQRLLGSQPLCVYATGSYGRLEAGRDSDIDLFFLYGGADVDEEFPFTAFVRVAAAIVDATEAMGFPPFTGNGEYLEVHYVRRMEEVLGSREDDSINAFTARMLLLLESRAVLAPQVMDRYFSVWSASTIATSPTILVTSSRRSSRTTFSGSGGRSRSTMSVERLKLRALRGDRARSQEGGQCASGPSSR